MIDGLSITIKPQTRSYSITGKTADWWTVPFPIGDDLQVKAGIVLSYDGSNSDVSENNQSRYSGNLSAEINYYSIDMKLSYEFTPDNKRFNLSIEGIKGCIEEVPIVGPGGTVSNQWIGSLSFGDQTIGGMVETFVAWATGETFGLASPWDLLNQISLRSLVLKFNFTTKKVSFNYPIGPITLPFGRIEAIGISYNPTAGRKR